VSKRFELLQQRQECVLYTRALSVSRLGTLTARAVTDVSEQTK